MGEGSVANPARLLLCAALCVAASLLAGCNETTSSIREPIKAAASAPARNPNASPRGASVALNLTGVENVPAAVVSRFSEALAHAADVREVEVVDPKLARYFVQMHLTAYPAGNGVTGLAYVSDVFDVKKNRAQRLGDDIVLKGTASDPWSLVDDKAVEAIAARSADDLAAFLSNTPEAIAAASAPPAVAARSAEPRERLRVPAPITTSPGMPAGALGFSAVR
jgi:predicted small secreted protein